MRVVRLFGVRSVIYIVDGHVMRQTTKYPHYFLNIPVVCTEKGCPARYIISEGNVLRIRENHNHNPLVEKVSVEKLKARIIIAARKDKDISAREIVEREFSRFHSLPKGYTHEMAMRHIQKARAVPLPQGAQDAKEAQQSAALIEGLHEDSLLI